MPYWSAPETREPSAESVIWSMGESENVSVNNRDDPPTAFHVPWRVAFGETAVNVPVVVDEALGSTVTLLLTASFQFQTPMRLPAPATRAAVSLPPY